MSWLGERLPRLKLKLPEHGGRFDGNAGVHEHGEEPRQIDRRAHLVTDAAHHA